MVEHMKIKIVSDSIETPKRKLRGKWTIEPMQEMRTGPETLWERIVSRVCYWTGQPCPYTDIMHGLDLEQEIVDALTKEINGD
jgi:hypothetical protein